MCFLAVQRVWLNSGSFCTYIFPGFDILMVSRDI